MAEEVFELSTLATLARAHSHAGAGELSETEFLTLDLLIKRAPLTIGEIQRSLNVAPAQMSRLVRALESKHDGGYINCAINPQDRRRVDVTLNESGRQAYDNYREARLDSIFNVLASLPAEDRSHFMRIMGTIRTTVAGRIKALLS